MITLSKWRYEKLALPKGDYLTCEDLHSVLSVWKRFLYDKLDGRSGSHSPGVILNNFYL